MHAVVAIISIISFALLIWYVYILMKGDSES